MAGSRPPWPPPVRSSREPGSAAGATAESLSNTAASWSGKSRKLFADHFFRPRASNLGDGCAKWPGNLPDRIDGQMHFGFDDGFCPAKSLPLLSMTQSVLRHKPPLAAPEPVIRMLPPGMTRLALPEKTGLKVLLRGLMQNGPHLFKNRHEIAPGQILPPFTPQNCFNVQNDQSRRKFRRLSPLQKMPLSGRTRPIAHRPGWRP